MLGIICLAANAQTSRTYHPSPFKAVADSALIIPLASTTDGVRAEARCAITKGKGGEQWGISLIGYADTLRVTLMHRQPALGDFISEPQTEIVAQFRKEKVTRTISDGFSNKPDGYNSLGINLSGGKAEIQGGNHKLLPILSLDVPDFKPIEALMQSSSPASVSLFAIEESTSPHNRYATDWTVETLCAHLQASTDSVEGFWKYLDRQNDPVYARLGGRYELATVKNPCGNYDIIYIGGAETMAPQWTACMLKGKLIPTIFTDHFDLEWVDSTFGYMKEDVHASITEGNILTLNFPLLKSSIRFSRVASR